MLNSFRGVLRRAPYIYIYIYIPLILLSVISFIIISIIFSTILFPNIAHADSVDYSVTVSPSLNLTIPTNTVALTLNPNSKTFDSKDLNITVATNNPTGYQLNMSSTGTSLVRDSSLDGKNATIETLPTLAGGYTESTFVANKWGYKKDSENYTSFTTNTPLLSNSTSTSNDSTTLTFASKIDYDQPAGTYAITLTFTAVANPLVQYMQNLDPTLCTTTPTSVIDKRDGEEYAIVKLADDNCWMLDNLRLDPTAVPLNKLKGNTNATDQTLEYLKNGGGSSPYPASGVIAKTATSGNWSNSYNLPYVVTSGTENNGWTKDTIASAKYGSGSGKIGVYYNFCAASAGSYCYALNTGTGDAQYDICPTGWKIPNGNQAKGSYYYLFYNLTEGYNGNIDDFRTALSTPLSGNINNGTAYNQNDIGNFWSASVRNSNAMYYLSVSSSNVNPQNTSINSIGRTGGLSIRCILK